MRFHASFPKLCERITQANFLIKNFGCTQHSSSKLDFVFAGTKFPLFPLFPRETRERPLLLFFIFIDIVFCMCERPILPQIPQMIADETQNNKNSNNHPQPVFLCDMMQPAAFLCVICAICGRIYIQTYSINIHRRTPSVSRKFRRFTQTKPKNPKPH